MPLRKQSGNMYPWVTHMHTHLAGECPHRCGYCYVQTNRRGVSPRWKGEPRLVKHELGVKYGTDKTIFIEHMTDLFAIGMTERWIKLILEHCQEFPVNQYVFQSKNPDRAFPYIVNQPWIYLFGTTIESNRMYPCTKAPLPSERYKAMLQFRDAGIKTFVTIEPIMDFDVDVLVPWLLEIKPEFINIGADSKKCELPEPPKEKVKELIRRLQAAGTVKIKGNLQRLFRCGGR